jgi:hypothetical protein
MENKLDKAALDALELAWREQQVKHYKRWTQLIEQARTGLLEGNLDWIQDAIEQLESLRCAMANGDTKRFMAHGFIEAITAEGCEE